MKKSLLGLSLLISAGSWMVGCGDDEPCPGGQVSCDGVCIDAIEPTLTSIQANVFTPTCAFSSCHDDDLPASELDLSSVSASEQNLIGIPSVEIPTRLRVERGDSRRSYLANKVNGIDMAPGTAQMPLNNEGEVLCQPKLDAIIDWIDNGAPTN
jgi:hypothetical protein